MTPAPPTAGWGDDGRALAERPGDGAAWLRLGYALAGARVASAARALERAARLITPPAEVHRFLADRHLTDGRDALAAAGFARALATDPSDAVSLHNLGVIALGRDAPARALTLFDRARRLAPGLVSAHVNAGRALADLNRPDRAVIAYDLALALDPALAIARHNGALARLSLGDHRGGYRALEARLALGLAPPLALARAEAAGARRWRRGASLAGARVLIVAEEGLGDVVQFLRFVPEVMARAAAVALMVQAPLAPLTRRAFPGLDVRSLDDPPPPADLVTPFLSLGHLLGATTGSPDPYLPAPPKDATPGPGRRVALASAGNPAHARDAHRSIPLALIEDWFTLPGIHWDLIQPHLRPGDLEVIAPHPTVRWLGAAETGLEDRLAPLARADIVISVDTVWAHVAGAMGRPVWILLPLAADWRWGPAGDRTPWYASARLIRQSQAGDWAGVAAIVRRALTAGP